MVGVTLRVHPDRVVARIEMAWADGDLSVVADLVHEAAVLVPREGGPSFCGRDPFLRFFRRPPNFAFEHLEPGGSWQTWDDAAVFERPIFCSVGADDSRRRIRAREVWVLARRDGLWSVVWHTTCDLPLQA
jgi:ketosteroid isomerase-like protein